MNFAFFLLLNAVLLIRPEELFPSLAGARLYLILLVLCTVTSARELLHQLSAASFRESPLSFYLICYLVLVSISTAIGGGTHQMLELASHSFKNALYFFLFLATVNTSNRFVAVLSTVLVSIATVSLLSVLQYHDVTDFQSLAPYHEGYIDPETGEFVGHVRLRGSGLMNDPNDMCQILMLGTLCCLARRCYASNSLSSLLWLMPIPLFAYAAILTQSRGGLLGILAGLSGPILIRFGLQKGFVVAIGVIFAGIFAVGGRQANVSTAENDTGHQRIMIWSDSFAILFSHPHLIPTGLGNGAISAEMGLVAHNSFVQAYVETGVIGGTLFACLLLLPLLSIFQMRSPPDGMAHDGSYALDRIRGYIFGIPLGFTVGCLSLTRNLAETAYLFFAIGCCYLLLTKDQQPDWMKLDMTFLKRTFAFGLAGFILIRLSIQVLQKI